jgi:hypothetical protein
MFIPLKNFLYSNSDAVLIKTSFKVNIESIILFFEKEVKKYPKEYQLPKDFHGGWSVQSNTGEISDGWQIGGAAAPINGVKISNKFENIVKKTFPNAHDNTFLQPTELYRGPMKNLIEDLESLKFKARRTRFADLEPGGVDNWHIDNGFTETWRGHIVLSTNPKSLFQWKLGEKIVEYNVPVDGHLYLARIDKHHRVSNQGNSIRTHIITDNHWPMNLFDVDVEAVLTI